MYVHWCACSVYSVLYMCVVCGVYVRLCLCVDVWLFVVCRLKGWDSYFC